ncbi:MAG: NADH-quinone oxidoreductase subunit C [Acidobacteria bacterium]|nr:NADH-quinone oxidoreductase subunit C [Acidobacteriota bacterium]
MLADNLKEMPVPAAIEAWDPDAILHSSFEHGETTLWISPDKILPLCAHLKASLQFNRLSGLTAIDLYPQEPRFEVVYLLHSIPANQRLKLKVALPGDNPALPSVTSVWAGADWYEREAFDLFGVTFTGHPDLRRIMLPDYWEGHPLRRDFPTHGHKYSYKDE